MKKFKIALAGTLGHFHYVLDSARLSDCSLVGISPGIVGGSSVAEDIGDCARQLRQEHPDCVVYRDCEEMLSRSKPDIVIVNSIFSDNCTLSRMALERGVHVFCEKPLATSFEELLLLYDDCRAAGARRVHLAGMFGLRYNSAVRTLLHAVRTGAVGEISMINIQKSYKLGIRHPLYARRETYGGIIPWVAIHAIDWIYQLVGERFVRVAAQHTRNGNGSNGDMESGALCVYALEGGAVASVNADMLRPEGAMTHDDDRIRVAGDRGIVELRNGRVYLCDSGPEREMDRLEAGDIFAEFLDGIEGNSLGSGNLGYRDAIYVPAAALLSREAADTGRVISLGRMLPYDTDGLPIVKEARDNKGKEL
ncbi:MAG: Gfo/Idh/MocA family oxidoreductase [Clostridiales bacterium]|nr:Gfo/Idh/MocA family oxidoreductase [Clostridiales bacterium]